MSAARNRLAATVGVVKVLEPNAKGYYRLKWTEPDGTPGDTSAGKILELAPEKATEINNRVTSEAGPKAVTALDVVAAEAGEQDADRGQPSTAPSYGPTRTPRRTGRA